MPRRPIPPADLLFPPFSAIHPEGALLVCGRSLEDANPMTVSWGLFGVMWGRPTVMAMVRPSRHTWTYLAEAKDFTLCWLPQDQARALTICGAQSGRDINKWEATGLHAETSKAGLVSPIVRESTLALECRVLYRHDLVPQAFLDPDLHRHYGGSDHHRLFFGEIVAAEGIEEFRRRD